MKIENAIKTIIDECKSHGRKCSECKFNYRTSNKRNCCFCNIPPVRFKYLLFCDAYGTQGKCANAMKTIERYCKKHIDKTSKDRLWGVCFRCEYHMGEDGNGYSLGCMFMQLRPNHWSVKL